MRVPVIGFAAGAVEETMNGGGLLLRKKDFPATASLIACLDRDPSLRLQIMDGQLRALEKYAAGNVSRILLDHVQKVSER